MRRFQLALACFAAAAASLAVACSKEPSSPGAGGGGGASPYALKADLPGGMPVHEARTAAPKDDVVVVGRVRELTSGLAAFTFIDTDLKYCGENKMEGCPHPWDFCCYPPGKVRENLISVIVKGKDGGVATIDRLAELRNLDLVAVKGALVKDKDGNVTLEATGWFRRERPTLPEGLTYPQ